MKKSYAVLFAVTAMSAAVALAQPGGEMMGRGKGEMNMKHRPDPEKMMEALDLTAEQRQAMDDAQSAFRMNMIDLRANAEKARLTLQEQMRKETVNHDAVIAAVEAEGAAELAVRKAVVEHQLAVRTILGPEKFQRMHEMRKEKGDEFRGRGGNDGRGGAGGQDEEHGRRGSDRGGDEDHDGGEHHENDD